MKTFLVSLFLFPCIICFAQQTDTAATQSWQTLYRATATKSNDLVHTKLDVRFDYTKSRLYGKAWLTLHPHFYPTNQLVLNAKGMTFTEISRVSNGKNIALSYTYDTLQLTIKLDKVYQPTESYTLYLNYTAAPDEFKKPDSILTINEKGLYFINPTGAIQDKPIQIWTQGETEANSCWVPTIDKPN